jgi:hypothetical protein
LAWIVAAVVAFVLAVSLLPGVGRASHTECNRA